MTDIIQEKRLAAERSLEYVRDGMCLGLGSGSTAAIMLGLLGRRVREGLRVRGVPTSEMSRELAEREGIPIVGFDRVSRLDLTIDGADEVDGRGRLIKGGGGALLMEKVVAYASGRFVVVVDRGKLSDRLGSLFPVPIEVVPGALAPVRRALQALGAEVGLRMAVRKAGPVVTDLGNLLLDARFRTAFDPSAIEAALDAIPGVLGNGLFTRRRPEVLAAGPGGIETLKF